PSRVPAGGGPAVHPPERPPLLPVPGIRAALLPVGGCDAVDLQQPGGRDPDRARGVRAVLQRRAPERLFAVVPLAPPRRGRPPRLLLLHSEPADPPRRVALDLVPQPPPHGVGVGEPD